MERLLRFLAGYVRIQICGGQTERFLNLCRSRGIVIRDLCWREDSCMAGWISLQDFFRLRPIRNKTKVHIQLTEKHGMPFFLQRSKKRKAFFLGILLCAVLLWLLSCRIWSIHMEGNIRNTTPEILSFLRRQGVAPGVARKDINCAQIAAAIRRQYGEIAWVSARMEGTRLILTIQEGDFEEQKSGEQALPCDLVADVEGTIVKMVARSGVPAVKTGDVCKKGDLLVAGVLNITNDNQEVVRREYVPADADIYVKHRISYYYEFPLAHETEISVGKDCAACFLKLGKWYFEAGPRRMSEWKTSTVEYPLRVAENFVLPVSFGLIHQEKYRTIKEEYTAEEAKKIAWEHLELYEENLMEKGVQISVNNVKIETDGVSCTSRGNLEVIEKTGRSAPIKIQEQPTERILEDG